MKIEIRMAIMSHLSDAEEIIRLSPTNAKTHIEFAKALLVKYDDISVKETEEELNKIWHECCLK